MPYIPLRRRSLEEFTELDEMDAPLVKHTDKRKDKVYCVYCGQRMELLSTPDVQWLCGGCGCIAREGLGDTPSRDTGMKALSTPNNPFPTSIDTTNKAVMQDILLDSDHDDKRLKMERMRLERQRGKRFGMMFDIQSAEQASKAIEDRLKQEQDAKDRYRRYSDEGY